MKTLRSKQHELLIAQLKKLRNEKGITQECLASILGKPQSYVAKIEGLERRIDVVEFVAWLKALDTKQDERIRILSLLFEK